MGKMRRTEIAPLFEAYGAACYEACHLERGLRLLLAVGDYFREKDGRPLAVHTESDATDAKKTLGRLFEEAQKKEWFTRPEMALLSKSIRNRNALIHEFWDERILVAVDPGGRQQLAVELEGFQELFRTASRIIGSMLDKHLERAGVSIHYFAESADEAWKNDADLLTELTH